MDDALNLLDDLDLELPEGFDFAEAEADNSVAQGTFFGPYQVIADVGKGGVARVMRARHIHPSYADTTFAIKVLHDELARDPRVVSFFRNEAFVLSMLKHPNIVQTFEAGTQDDKVFIAMEYIDGRDLDEMIARCKKFHIALPTELAMFVVTEVLEALAYAHELTDGDGELLRLVHRDINPANVFMSYDGHVKLGDFGVASVAAEELEKSRELAGKIGYFAPEQLAGEAIDQRADLFSTGVMMFEIFTGQRLFDGSDQNKILRLNKKAKIPRPSKLNPAIPPGLEAVILRALERKPEDRFQSAREMRDALMPFSPDPSGMPLAIASLMRMVFLQEHIQELQLREGLNGSAAVRGSGQHVALFTTDQRARIAFSELLNSRGYRVMPFTDISTFRLACSQSAVPDVLMVGVADAALVAGELAQALASLPTSIPVIGVCDNLDASICAVAQQLGAVDLLSKPFNIERVLTSVRAALSGAAQVIAKREAQAPASAPVRTKILVVSADPSLVARLTTGLTEATILVDVASSPAEALALTLETSYDGVVFDAPGGANPARVFMNQFRSQPGMGLVPVVYLSDPGTHHGYGDLEQDRSFVCSRTEYAKTVVNEMNRLLADTRMGRSFIRYDTSFPVELRFGGRVFAGDAINVSRGGLMLRCVQLPPIGEAVSVGLRFPGSHRGLEVNGSVIRVDMARQEGELPRIGVSFERFTGRGEVDLIEFLSRLDQQANRRQTVIIGAPPPVQT